MAFQLAAEFWIQVDQVRVERQRAVVEEQRGRGCKRDGEIGGVGGLARISAMNDHEVHNQATEGLNNEYG